MASSSSSSAGISHEQRAQLHAKVASSATFSVCQNAVLQHGVASVAKRASKIASLDHSMSIKLDKWKVTNQKASGRCWLFAGLNVMRVKAMQALNVKEFEFSQAYMFFFDKLERANYFLESMRETAQKPLDDRTVAFLMSSATCLSDGGQLNMFENLVQKYGVVPKSAMPESNSSEASRGMNGLLVARLRQGAQQVRALVNEPEPGTDEQFAALKAEILADVYRVLALHLGTPPERFEFQWRDKDDKFERWGELTPLEFAARLGVLDKHVCLVHDPRASSPPNRTFTVRYLQNVADGDSVVYLNVDIGSLKSYVVESLQAGVPVWFGCDVGKHFERANALWDVDVFDYETVYGFKYSQTKAERINTHGSEMTHAMVFSGVDIGDDGQPTRFRVENSWGPDRGINGYYTMTPQWFAEYVFEIAVPRDSLTDEHRAALDQEHITLPAWDPFGSLARQEAMLNSNE
jgi:bleomycin hydrolase